jgi:hypothetical protein
MFGVAVNDGIWSGGADSKAEAPGVNNGAKALALIVAGVVRSYLQTSMLVSD